MDDQLLDTAVPRERGTRSRDGEHLSPHRDDPRSSRARPSAECSNQLDRDPRRATGAAPVNDRGSVLPLVAGLCAFTGVVVVGIIGSTDLALSRTELQTVADGAAIAAAGTVTPSSVSFSGSSLVIRLTSSSVRRDATVFLRNSRTQGIKVAAASSPDSRTAVVTLSTVWRPPLVSEFLPVRMVLTATARARSVLR